MSGQPVDAAPATPAALSDVVECQPVGTLIVDEKTIVRYANPAAADLLGVPAERLVGEMFGLPILPGGVTDVNVPGGVTDMNVPGEADAVRTLAMRVIELPPPGPGALGGHLISLFDVSGRARRYEREHRVVESLQRSLLLEHMPELPGVSLAARYIPGEGEIRVGGDWYDAIPLTGGRLGLVIGDVVGHGIESAALMSQLRNGLRAYALEHESPARVLEQLDRMLVHLEPGGMATVIYLVYDPAASTLTFAAAGHPYPLLVEPGGGRTFLRGGRSMPLGTGFEQDRPDGAIRLPAASMLVLYTDGLVERRTRPLDDGLAALSASLEGEVADPEGACDRILASLLGEGPPMDDVAVLIMSTRGRT